VASDTKHIFQSLAVNVCIAVGKGIAALVTGSGAMLAETLHSSADCSNQLLLLLGLKRSEKPPDAAHPLGYGRSLYFWSFIVALLLFSGGGVFSIYEGVHKLGHPEPLEHVGIGLAILVGSLLLESWATWGNLKELNLRRGSTGLAAYLKKTKDSDLVVLFGENSAAVLGLCVAIATMLVAWVTGNVMWDAVGSILIGGILVLVAIFLGAEVSSLLIGESADPSVERGVRELISNEPKLKELLRILTIQQGPGEIIVALKLRFVGGVTLEEAITTINGLERSIKQRHPDVRWCFVEPDSTD
jgi:cation diffusion facilitator family transporter